MIRKQSFMKPLSLCFLAFLMVVSINISQIEAQDGLNPLVTVWKMGGIIQGIPLDITGDVDFPDLTGPYQHVGRTSFSLQYSQTGDPMNPLDLLYTEDIYDSGYVPGNPANKPRKFMVWVHYPTDEQNCQAAPYIPVELASAMETAGVIVDETMFNMIHPHTCPDPSLSTAQPYYPVLIFSHGKNMHPLFYTAILEELASQGYIVVSIVHPHDAPASVFTDDDDGVVVDVLYTPNGDENQFVQDAVATPEILTMYEIGSRPKDVLLTLLSLAMMNSDPESKFYQHLALTNVGMFGHSFGAGTSAWASQRLSQYMPSLAFKATLFLDTSAVPLVLEPGTGSLSEPVMFMDGSGAEYEGTSFLVTPEVKEATRSGSITNIVDYLMSTNPFYFFELETATHYTYVSDLVLLASVLANFDPYGGVPLIGPDIGNEGAVNIINAYMTAFFNEYLKSPGEPLEPLLEGPSCYYPEVCFRKQPLTIPPCSWLYSSSPPITPTPDPNVIPEPGTIILFGLGILGILALLRRKCQR